MATGTDQGIERIPTNEIVAQAGAEKIAKEKILSEVSEAQRDEPVAKPGASKNSQSPDVVEHREVALPALSLHSKTNTDSGGFSLPWQRTPDGFLQAHMGYQQSKDGIVHIGEGPHHVAKRLLGPNAIPADVNALTDAMTAEYLEEHPGRKLSGIRIGHPIINEGNIESTLARIGDDAARQRIADRLKDGWTEKEQPTAVPFGPHGRPGETTPSRIDDPEQFLKDIAAAAIDVGAAALRSKGKCAQGARLAINELPLWHIDGGTVDKSINKDPNGWRSGITMALDLGGTGLFDIVPLSKLGYKNLKEGYILGRYHYPNYVKEHPAWDGEDFGDIDIVTKKHMPPNDDSDMYHDSFVLIPKKAKS